MPQKTKPSKSKAKVKATKASSKAAKASKPVKKAAKIIKKTATGKKALPIQKLQQKVQAKSLAESEDGRRKRPNPNITSPEITKLEIDKLLSNERATEYLRRNVSKTAIDVICMLATPKTDEQLVDQLGMKINAIRRILNIMQGYGITNYYVSKNTKGWLSFSWYINTNKLKPFLEYVDHSESEKSIINSNCNDYFMCDNCYKNDKLLYTFDAAFESSFKCGCGKNLARMDKTEAETVINTIKPVA